MKTDALRLTFMKTKIQTYMNSLDAAIYWVMVILSLGVFAGSAQTGQYPYSGTETNITLSPGTYDITAYGAQGGYATYYGGHVGGLGAEMAARFTFTTTVDLTILVGGAGNTGGDGGGGGGGSFVVNGATPLVIAGGGGGAAYDSTGGTGSTSTNGENGGGGDAGGGGSAGNGGGWGGTVLDPAGGAGGGGYYTGAGSSGYGGGGGSSFLDGGGGGSGGVDSTGNPFGGAGGFGCSGGGGFGGGGGGGYSGGGGALTAGGGGGGSIIDSSATTNLVEISGVASPDDSPNGEVIIVVPQPPSFIEQPSLTAAFTSNVTFQASAQGPGTLGFQWYFNGTTLSDNGHYVGSMVTNLTIMDFQPGDIGDYTLVATNYVGSTTSAMATINILNPTITSQPLTQVVVGGNTGIFSVSSTGQQPLTYQWQFNGTNLTDGAQTSGSTNSILTISNAQNANAGPYQVIISNNYSAVTSSVAFLYIYAPVQIIGQPTNVAVLSGSNVSFTVTAAGVPISYQWYFNGSPLTDGGNISGSKNPTLNITDAQIADTGIYTVQVTNVFSAATSSNASLTVYNPVQITTQPVTYAVPPGKNASFTVGATGTALGYQWYFNGNPLTDGGQISGSASSVLTIIDVQNSNYGNYSATVTNILSAAISQAALLLESSNHYVNLASSAPASPYLTWSTAATNIQDAINASIRGDTIIVTDGVYQCAGYTAPDGTRSMVVITNAITIQSVNGSAATSINGSNAMRCVYLANGAALTGFTLTDGNSGNVGGGVYCPSTAGTVISNCVITANTALIAGGGAYQGTFFNCIISQNFVESPIANGGGVGGGAFDAVLVGCIVLSNSIFGGEGIGIYNSDATNSLIADNYPLFANPTSESQTCYGGGAYGGNLDHCNITGNSASEVGGTYNANLVNCIDYFNSYNTNFYNLGNSNYEGGTINYTCATPKPLGNNNIATDPQLASPSHISLGSPCRGTGSATNSSGVDLDGNAWANPPSMGCFEPYPGSVLGNVTVSISTPYTNWAPNFSLNFQANIFGPVYSNLWNFGDGTFVTNQAYVSHTWTTPGIYPVTLTAYNDSYYPTGITATLPINVTVPSVYYVNLDNFNAVPPYITPATAAMNIQDAVNVAVPGSLVLVTNGPTLPIYNFYFTNSAAFYVNGGAIAPDGKFYRVVITNAITVQSMNGPATTYIWGVNPGGALANCVYLTNGATLYGFTITNTLSSYGQITATSTNAVITNCIMSRYVGVNSGTLDNCILTGSSGAANSILNNCLVTGLGVTINSTLNNCLLTGSGSSGNCTLNNCIVSNNPSVVQGGILNNCCLINNSNSADGGAAIATQGYPLVLNNCLISNNISENGGGVYNGTAAATNCVLNNCILTENIARSEAGAAFGAKLNNCLIISNSAPEGGGVQGGVLNNCTLIANSGVGALNAVLTNCSLIANVSGGAMFCTLSQCTLSQNLGIGASSSALNDCLIISNSLPSQTGRPPTTGGGAYFSELTNCIIAYNAATNGGGAYRSTLVNCTVIANTAVNGGGIYQCTANNCILYYNINGDFYPNTSQYPLNYCCASTQATYGIRNITNAPLFVNLAGGDYHLQSSGPCINSGNNAYITASTDLDGNPRIQGGTVDIGAYEYQTPTSVISYAYLQQYGLPTDGSVDFKNLNGTAFNVYQDWIAGLNPTNPASVLAMVTPAATNTTAGVKVTWQSASGISYFLQRSTNLISQPPFTTIQSNITGQTNTTSYTDTTATGNIPYFYRVGVTAP